MYNMCVNETSCLIAYTSTRPVRTQTHYAHCSDNSQNVVEGNVLADMGVAGDELNVLRAVDTHHIPEHQQGLQTQHNACQPTMCNALLTNTMPTRHNTC